MMLVTTKTQTLLLSFPSELGWFGVALDETGVCRLHFGHASENAVWKRLTEEFEPADMSAPEWWENAQNLLVRFADGECVDLTEIPASVGSCTAFQQNVIDQLQQVGYGETISYAVLAERAGSTGAARAVGNQMAKNCIPLIIPCHRVIGSGGRLGGFSAPQGLKMKRRLLEMEQAGLF